MTVVVDDRPAQSNGTRSVPVTLAAFALNERQHPHHPPMTLGLACSSIGVGTFRWHLQNQQVVKPVPYQMALTSAGQHAADDRNQVPDVENLGRDDSAVYNG